jgi:predicted RNA-binding protein with PUA-like domain
MPAYWLIKTEPDEYSWQNLVVDGKTDWTGVRNYTARNNLKAMKIGDLAFFYHSVKGTEIVGISKVVKTAFQDPTTDNPAWVAVQVAPHKALAKSVKLNTLKQDPFFAQMDLVRLGRLSVGKVTEEEFSKICRLGGIE